MAEQTEYSGADLLKFLKQDMVMSSHYQPLIVKELVLAGGTLSADELAKKLLLADRFEVERARAILASPPWKGDRRRASLHRSSSR